MTRKHSAEDVVAAIRDSDGYINVVAKRLGVDRSTVYRYINRWKTVADALEDERETTKDDVEAELMRQIRKGNTAATIFFLKTRAKDRGYVERLDVGGVADRPIHIVLREATESDVEDLENRFDDEGPRFPSS